MAEELDPLMRSLSEEARALIEQEDKERLDPRWDDYSAGQLSRQDVEALRSESSSTSEEDKQLAAVLFEPLDGDERASFVHRLQQEIGAVESPRSRHHHHESTIPSPEQGPRQGFWQGFRWLMSSRPQALWATAGAGALLLALVVLPVLLQSPIPSFSLDLQGIEQVRSGSANEPILQVDGPVHVRLQPSMAVSEPLKVSVFVRLPSGELQRWSEAERSLTPSNDGTFTAKDLRWSWGAGDRLLVFIIGRKAMPLKQAASLVTSRGTPQESEPDWQMIKKEVQVLP